MFEKYKRQSAANRLAEEKIYKVVLEELENGFRRGGLWAKALANGSGDEAKARGLYISYRVQSIKDEAELLEPQIELLEPQIEQESEEDRLAEKAMAILADKGFEVIKKKSGWEVVEPVFGARQHVRTAEFLYNHAQSRKCHKGK